jgi:hypothetical protein
LWHVSSLNEITARCLTAQSAFKGSWPTSATCGALTRPPPHTHTHTHTWLPSSCIYTALQLLHQIDERQGCDSQAALHMHG